MNWVKPVSSLSYRVAVRWKPLMNLRSRNMEVLFVVTDPLKYIFMRYVVSIPSQLQTIYPIQRFSVVQAPSWCCRPVQFLYCLTLHVHTDGHLYLLLF